MHHLGKHLKQKDNQNYVNHGQLNTRANRSSFLQNGLQIKKKKKQSEKFNFGTTASIPCVSARARAPIVMKVC